MPGSPMSSTQATGRSRRAAASPAAPSDSTCTPNPSRVRYSFTRSAIDRSSSTTSTSPSLTPPSVTRHRPGGDQGYVRAVYGPDLGTRSGPPAGRAILFGVRIRDPRPPEEPDDGWEPPEAEPVVAPQPAEPGPARTSVGFSVSTAVIAAKIVSALVLLGLTLGFGVREQIPIGLAATVGVAVYAARDVLARERLRADATGLVAVHGYASRQHLDWSDVEQILVQSRLRLGVRAETLEVDAGEAIFMFSRYDLGVEPREALTMLTEIPASAGLVRALDSVGLEDDGEGEEDEETGDDG